MNNDLMDTSLVCKLAGFSRRTLYRAMKRGNFPPPLPDLSGHKKPAALLWVASVILDWVCKNNPFASNGKYVNKKEIAVLWNLSYGRVNMLSKKDNFPISVMNKKGTAYYELERVNEWMNGQKFRKKKTNRGIL